MTCRRCDGGGSGGVGGCRDLRTRNTGGGFLYKYDIPVSNWIPIFVTSYKNHTSIPKYSSTPFLVFPHPRFRNKLLLEIRVGWSLFSADAAAMACRERRMKSEIANSPIKRSTAIIPDFLWQTPIYLCVTRRLPKLIL